MRRKLAPPRPPYSPPHEFRLPVIDDAAVLHQALDGLPGFGGVVTRGDVAYALFPSAPPLGVAKQVVRRLSR